MKAETKHKVVRTIFISAVFALFALMFWPFATPILIAGLFAYALHDVVTRMSSKKHLNRRTTSLLLILGLIVFVAAPLGFIVLTAVETVKSYTEAGIENTSVYQHSTQLLSDITEYVQGIAEKFNLQSSIPKIKNYFTQFSSGLGGRATKIFAAIPKLAMSLIVFFLALYFFLNESASIKKLVLRYDLLPQHDLNKINAMIKRSSFQALIASILIAAAQALLIATFAYFCDYTEFFLVFIIAFMFALIPVVGSGPVPLFLAAISFIQGNTGAGVAMLVCLGIASTLDNVIKAFIIRGDDDRIHPIVSLLALIGGLIVYGMPGILLGPVLTQMAFNILDIQHSGEKSGEFKPDSDL
jgi:predicted PurR-regulated permease PerM